MRTGTALAIRHVAFEDLGSFAPVLRQRGFILGYREAGLDDLKARDIRDADLVIVLGGPIGVYETAAYPFLKDEIKLIEQRLKSGRPVLGICLGAQLIARALGARVYKGKRKELAWGPIALTEEGRASALAALDARTSVLHWHGDTFDLPRGATLLASNRNYANQAFAFEQRALGAAVPCRGDSDRARALVHRPCGGNRRHPRRRGGGASPRDAPPGAAAGGARPPRAVGLARHGRALTRERRR